MVVHEKFEREKSGGIKVSINIAFTSWVCTYLYIHNNKIP